MKQPTDAKGLPGSGYGIEVDGLLKSEFVTMEGATNGARELKTRFPMLQIAFTTRRRRRGPKLPPDGDPGTGRV